VQQVIFLGPPGSGKGTQAARLAEILQIPHISTGEILRSNVSQETPLGQKAKAYMDRGDLVPDQLVLDMVEERLKEPDTQQGWILDGFPRTVSQAHFVAEKLLDSEGNSSEAELQAINLDVPDDVLVERLLARGRQDDNEETIRRRLHVYREQTAPLIEFYRDRGQLHDVDGHRGMDEVTAHLAGVVAPQ
jgi:adenylate kinase